MTRLCKKVVRSLNLSWLILPLDQFMDDFQTFLSKFQLVRRPSFLSANKDGPTANLRGDVLIGLLLIRTD